ncbi:MAG: hypothetical protein ACRD2O_09580, partial [Terriglobia bacterium]
MDSEPSLNLLLELETEVTRWRRRTMFLLSVMFHIMLAFFLIESPSLFRRGEALLGVQPQPKQETTFLVVPPDLLRRLKSPPKTNILSDKNRLAHGRAPKINPNALHMPYMRGRSRLPEVTGGGRPKPKPTPPQPVAQPKPQTAPPGQQTQAQVERPVPSTKQEAGESKLKLEDVQTPKPQPNTLAQAMRMSTPEEVMRQT